MRWCTDLCYCCQNLSSPRAQCGYSAQLLAPAAEQYSKGQACVGHISRAVPCKGSGRWRTGAPTAGCNTRQAEGPSTEKQRREKTFKRQGKAKAWKSRVWKRLMWHFVKESNVQWGWYKLQLGRGGAGTIEQWPAVNCLGCPPRPALAAAWLSTRVVPPQVQWPPGQLPLLPAAAAQRPAAG